jgi:hypothetical protein
MKADKRKRLESKGWKVGSVNEFLSLAPEEAAYIELKLSLSNSLKERRSKGKLSQVEVAKLIKTSHMRDRVALGVSLERFVRAWASTYASRSRRIIRWYCV